MQNNIASHNTMTYFEPAKWWMKIFNSIAKCQNKTLQDQVELGVNVFDIRVRFNKEFNLVIAHGLVEYKYNVVFPNISSIFEYLKYLRNCKIRIVLEISKYNKYKLLQKILFIQWLNSMIEKYPTITFFEGTSKYDWEYLNDKCTNNIPPYNQYVSSMKGKGIYRIFPKLYAKKYNKRVVNTITNTITFIDYIGNYY